MDSKRRKYVIKKGRSDSGIKKDRKKERIFSLLRSKAQYRQNVQVT